MAILFFEDNLNVRTNSVTSVTRGIGSAPIADNLVLKVVFSEESTTEPLTLQEAKDWCRIDVTDDDAIITRLITAARRICEKTANLSFILRTVTATFKNGLGDIELPYGPVAGYADYFESDGITAITGFDILQSNMNKIVAVYQAGYTSADLPEEYRNAIGCQVAWMYQNRGDAKLSSMLSLESSLILNQVRSV